MRFKPKECVNKTCRRIMFVPDYKLHMLLQCNVCIDRMRKRIKRYDQQGWVE